MIKRIGIFMAAVLTVVLLSTTPLVAADGKIEKIMDGFESHNSSGTRDGEASEESGVLEGFDEEYDTPASPLPPTEAAAASPISLDGFFKVGSTVNVSHDAPENTQTDWRGISRLRTELQLEVGIKPGGRWQAFASGKGFYDAAYRLNGRGDYTDAVLDEYEDEVELREAYLLISPGSRLDIKAGRQIVVWGKSDNIRITDVLNPLDLREPGLTDIEDLRLPVAMTRVDLYAGDWNLTGIALHEIRFNKLPVYGHDFFTGSVHLPPEEIPSDGGGNTEWAFSLSGVFSGWDMALYAARIFDDDSHFEPCPAGPGLIIKHARLSMAGLAWNIALGNWLLKTEAAYFDGLLFFNTPGRDYTRTDALLGIEYSGFSETVLSLDAAIRHLNNYDDVLKNSPDLADGTQFQWAFRAEKNFLNDTLSVTLLASVYGAYGEDGAFTRLSANYDIIDGVEVSGGVVLYQDGDLPQFQKIGDNDRLFMEIKWSF